MAQTVVEGLPPMHRASCEYAQIATASQNQFNPLTVTIKYALFESVCVLEGMAFDPFPLTAKLSMYGKQDSKRSPTFDGGYYLHWWVDRASLLSSRAYWMH